MSEKSTINFTMLDFIGELKLAKRKKTYSKCQNKSIKIFINEYC